MLVFTLSNSPQFTTFITTVKTIKLLLYSQTRAKPSRRAKLEKYNTD